METASRQPDGFKRAHEPDEVGEREEVQDQAGGASEFGGLLGCLLLALGLGCQVGGDEVEADVREIHEPDHLAYGVVHEIFVDYALGAQEVVRAGDDEHRQGCEYTIVGSHRERAIPMRSR